MLLAELFQNNQDNTSKTVSQLLHRLKIPVTDSTVTTTLEEHPDFPSLFSISDSLKKWKVDNMAIEVDEEKFDDIPTPFIAYLWNKSFVTVVKTGNDSVSYISPKGKLISKNKQDFLKEWSHVVLVVEAMPGAGEKDFIKNKRSERIQNLRLPLAIGALLLLVVSYILISALQFGAQTSALTG